MFLLTFAITAFTAVMAQDLFGISYHYDKNFLESLTQKNCENKTRWELVSYDELEIDPPTNTSSTAIRSSRNSCASSLPIDFLNGTLEVTVYLRTISENSGITISVVDEKDHSMTAVKYQRRKKKFNSGWTVVSIPIKKHASGYVQLSGQSLSSELVIVDSLKYTPEHSSTFIKDKQTLDFQSSPAHTRLLEDDIEDEPFIFEFDTTNGSGDEDIEGSGDSVETESPVTDNPDNQTDEPESGTDEADSGEIRDNPKDPGFWNAFTVTLVSVGVFVVLGSIGVGSYHLGKNAGRSRSPPLDLETPETPSEIIPRVRSVYRDRFSRFS